MLKLKVVDTKGKSAGEIELDPEEFGGEVNRQLLHDVVVNYLANQRQGTAFTKRRGEVAGHKKKLFKQKGTGNARAGTRRTNKRRGGGTAKGPRPRDFSYQMPRKMRQAATRMALLSKFQDNETVVVDGLKLASPKTKEMTAVLKAIGVSGNSCLISTAQDDKNVYLSARNLPGTEVMSARELNAYAVLRPKRLVITREALTVLREKAKGSAGKAEE